MKGHVFLRIIKYLSIKIFEYGKQLSILYFRFLPEIKITKNFLSNSDITKSLIQVYVLKMKLDKIINM